MKLILIIEVFMSKDQFTVIAKRRSEQGKGASRRLRRLAELVPGIVYGGNTAPEMLMLEQKHLKKLLENEAFYSHILNLEVEGNSQRVVLKDLQRHPYKPFLLHVDFQRITGKEKILMHVPLHFIGEDKAPGVKIEKGIVTHLATELEIRCLPDFLPEYIEVDLSHLKIGESIHISELKLPPNVESTDLTHGNDLPIANIQTTRANIEEDNSAAPAASAVAVEPKGKEKTAEKK